MNLDKKTIIEISVAILVIILLSVAAFWGYKYYSENKENQGSEVVETVQNCEELKLITPANVAAPTVPVLESKLNANAKTSLDICEWSVNDKPSHKSIPVDGKCVFGGKVLKDPGVYKVVLDVQDNNCSLVKAFTLQ